MGKTSIDLSPPLAKLHILYREDHRNSIVDGIFMVFFILAVLNKNKKIFDKYFLIKIL